jgi:hypothetical protein
MPYGKVSGPHRRCDLFFFDQDGLLPHEEGPLQVTVPRSELAPILT